MTRLLSEQEIAYVAGGFFWAAAPFFIAAGYMVGKDRKQRDRLEEGEADLTMCPAPQ